MPESPTGADYLQPSRDNNEIIPFKIPPTPVSIRSVNLYQYVLDSGLKLPERKLCKKRIPDSDAGWRYFVHLGSHA
jgi:hypothetical protein